MPIVEYSNGQYGYEPPGPQGVYPARVLPSLIGDAVLEVSTSLNVSVQLAAHAALATVSLVGQHFVNVQCPNFPPAPCALFLLAVSNSSGGKSLVEQRFLRAVTALELKLKEAAADNMPDFQARMKIWRDDERRLSKAYLDASLGTEASRVIQEQRLLHEKNKPVPPSQRELRFADLSPQGLRDMLVAHSAVGILSPEAGPVMNGPTFSMPALLSGYWSGEDRPVALVSGNRRPTSPRLTVSVVLQQERFLAYMKNRGEEAFGTGLLARFLPAFPVSFDCPGRQTAVEDAPEPKLDRFNARVADILTQPVPAPQERQNLQLSEGARYYWKLYTEAVNTHLICGPDSDNVKSFFRKLGEHAARLAALFHYFDGQPGDVSPEAMARAIVLCEWYVDEFMRMFTRFAPSEQQQHSEAAQKLLEWLQDAYANAWKYSKLTRGRYSERDLNNYSPIRSDPQLLSAAINRLLYRGEIATRPGKKGGRIIFYPAYMANNFHQPNFQSQRAMQGVNPGYIAPSCMPPGWSGAQFNGQNYPAPGPRSIFDMTRTPIPSQFDVPQNCTPAVFNNNVSPPVAEEPAEFLPQVPPNVMEIDTPEIRAIKQRFLESAEEAGLGPVSMSIQFRQG
ncbi:DUF3987 domain-containing protein [Paraburkholderia mimosarum]|uniref:DUF3987 domain-containing protein n=1 Tax=Paraburkholderia mimosarum TaxID=312026 RepID=UPI00138DD142|nr:DUF3987 domain-containing protein [Paraburkholderia mimosarum]